MQGLNDGDVPLAAYLVDRGRQQGKEIMHMYDVGREANDRFVNSSGSKGIVNRSQRRLDFVKNRLDLIVCDDQLFYLMACQGEQSRFIFEDNVFSSKLLVAIMSDENLHGISCGPAGSQLKCC